MKIRANINYPPPAFETRDLTFKEACKLVDALTAELVVTNRQLGACEAVLEHCKAWFDAGSKTGDEAKLLAMIDEVLK